MKRLILRYLFRKKVNYKIILLNLFSSLMILLSFFVFFNLKNIEERIMNESLSSNYFVNASGEKKNYDVSQLDFINEVMESSNYSIRMPYYNISFGGKEYRKKVMMIEAMRYDFSKGKILSRNELKEYEEKNHSLPLIMGSYPKAKDEMIVNEKFFKDLGISPIINEELTIEIPDGLYRGEEWISSLKVTGVISDKILDLDSFMELKQAVTPNLFFLSSELEDKEYIVNKYVTQLFMEDFKNIEKRSIALNSVFGENTFSFGNETKMIFFDSIGRYGSLISFILIFISSVLIFGFFLLDILLVYFDVKKNARKYLVYYSTGLTKEKCFWLIVINYCLVTLIGFLLGLIAFTVLLFVLRGEIPYVSLMTIDLPIVLSSFSCLLIITVLLLLLTFFVYKKQNILAKCD